LIYCVVPEALAHELFERLTAYYAADENVTVIVERRKAERRDRRVARSGGAREIRDRRQRPVHDRRPVMFDGG
jgi:hypothetical protein